MKSLPVLYRPTTFDEVVGQDSVIKILKKQIETGATKNVYMFAGSSGSGKAQPLTSKVLTPTGYVNMGDIKVGDIILDGKGNPTKVLGVFPQGKRDIYKIYLNDGTYIEVSDNHLNSIYKYKIKHFNHNNVEIEEKDEVLTTLQLKEIVDTPNYRKGFNNRLRLRLPIINCWENNNIKIDPYLLGCLIGDGGLSDSLLFSSKDQDIIDNLNNILGNDWDCKLEKFKTSMGNCDYKIKPIYSHKNKFVIKYKGEIFQGFGELQRKLVSEGYPNFDTAILKSISLNSYKYKSPTLKKYPELKNNIIVWDNPERNRITLKDELTNLNLRERAENKHIPQNYIFSSFDTRLALLQGLMDTDGTVEKRGTCYLSTSSERLAKEVEFLCRSLGAVAYIKCKKTPKYHYVYKNIDEIRIGKPNYCVHMRFPLNGIVPFKCKRKIQKWNEYNQNRKTRPRGLRYIIDVKFDRKDECQCIYVESPEHTYITDNLTITHNTTVARIFAKAINNGVGEPIEIDAASNSGVDNVRNIIRDAQEKSIEGKYKIFIIDEAQSITSTAWQAFLKCIEEPPTLTIFIFCTTDPQKIPETILNRVQRFNFNRIPTNLIKERLAYVCNAEGFTNYEESINYISRLANGCMREALTLLDKVADNSTDFNITDTLNILSVTDYRIYFSLVNDMLDGNAADILTTLDALYDVGTDLKVFTDQFLKFIIDIAKYILFNTTKVTNIPESFESNIKNIINFENPINYYNYVMDKLLELKNMLKVDVDVKSTVEVVCLQISRMQ